MCFKKIGRSHYIHETEINTKSKPVELLDYSLFGNPSRYMLKWGSAHDC